MFYAMFYAMWQCLMLYSLQQNDPGIYTLVIQIQTVPNDF